MEGPRDAHGTAAQTPPTMHEEELIAVPTEVNVVLAFLPRVVMAPMQTTMIRASMTAYSTAVGPSSRFRNRSAERRGGRMGRLHLLKNCDVGTKKKRLLLHSSA